MSYTAQFSTFGVGKVSPKLKDSLKIKIIVIRNEDKTTGSPAFVSVVSIVDDI